MYSLTLIIDDIRKELQARMDKITLRFKGSDSTGVYYEHSPKVYAYTYDELSDGLPIYTPSVLVQCLSLADGVASMLVHVCICNPARQGTEITTPVSGMNGVYEYGTSSDISSEGVRSELYRACLMLGEQVYLALRRMDNSKHTINNIILNTPSPYLENFPFCECSVSCDVSVSEVATKLDSDLAKYL